MNSSSVISFENTENAFAYKSDKELKRAQFLFKSMSYQWLVKIGHAPDALGYPDWLTR